MIQGTPTSMNQCYPFPVNSSGDTCFKGEQEKHVTPRRQKSGEYRTMDVNSCPQISSTWCRPRLRGKTRPTTPRKRAYAALQRALLHCD